MGPTGGYGNRPAPGYGPGPGGARHGIVPWRPLNVGDILAGSFAALRKNPKTIVGVSLAFYLVIALISLVPAAATGTLLDGGLFDDTTGPSVAVGTAPGDVFQWISSASSFLLTAFLITPIVALVRGDKLSPRQAWDACKGRLLPMFGLTLIGLLAVLVLTLPLIGIIVGAVLAAGDAVGVGLVLGILGGLALWLILLVVVFVPFVYAAPVIVLERVGPIAALRRSLRLVRGAFWRTLGVLLLAGLITTIVSVVLLVPVGIIGGLAGFATGGEAGAGLALLVTTILGVLVQAVAQPFSAGVNALLYVDRRLRTEGYEFIAGPQDRPVA